MSVPYVFTTRSDQWAQSGIEIDADFEYLVGVIGDLGTYISIFSPGATESELDYEGNRLFIIDGTLAAPLTGQTDKDITVYIERNEASDITAASNPNNVTLLVNHNVYAPGLSPGTGVFCAISGVAYMHGDGTSSADMSTHCGIWGVANALSTAENVYALGGAVNGIMWAGSGLARATGIEIAVTNDRADADTSLNYYSIGADIISGGSKDVTMGQYIHALGAGKFLTGIRVEDVIDPAGVGTPGSGLVLSRTGNATAPFIEFRNNDAESPGYFGFSGAAFQFLANAFDQVFAINLTSGSLQINDYTKSFPSAQTVSFGANDSGGVGYKVLRIPN
jgi:hypothetical protein